MFVTGNPVHFVFTVLAVLVGALDATARWGIIAGNGQADGGTVTEVDGLLYESFAERAEAYDGTAVVVLDGAGKDFAGRSRTLVNEYNQRCVLAAARTVGIFFHAGVFASLCVNNQFTLGQEFVDHADGGFHIASRILAQVDDDTLAVLVAQLGNGIQQFDVGRTAEFTDLDIAIVLTEHIGCVDGVLRNVAAGYHEVEQFFLGHTLDAQFHLAAFGTLQ